MADTTRRVIAEKPAVKERAATRVVEVAASKEHAPQTPAQPARHAGQAIPAPPRVPSCCVAHPRLFSFASEGRFAVLADATTALCNDGFNNIRQGSISPIVEGDVDVVEDVDVDELIAMCLNVYTGFNNC